MASSGSGTNGDRRGRPLDFDPNTVLHSAVDLFWREGFAGSTTRALEAELGVSQSSLYNTFGSKSELLEKVVEYYTDRLDAEVLAPLTVDDPDRSSILDFVDAISSWVGADGSRGCLVLNLAAEREDQGYRVADYRRQLRALLRPAVASFTHDRDEMEARIDLLVAAVFGLNITARSGADQGELDRLSAAVRHQVESW